MAVCGNDDSFSSVKKKRKGKVFWLLVFFLLTYGGYNYFFSSKETSSQDGNGFGGEENMHLAYSQWILGDGETDGVITYRVAEGDIPAEVFSTYGKFNIYDTMALIDATEDIFDFNKIKIGQNLRFYFEGEKRAYRMEYDRDSERMVIVEREGDKFTAKEEKIEYETRREVAKGTIDEFFYKDASDEGMSGATIMTVADIFSFSVDFTTEIRKGDEFSVIYEKRKRDGVDGPDGRIYAAKFINNGKTHHAYYFNDNGSGGYYDEEGRALERQFLRAPLSYSRITSGFTGARLHPITRKVTEHYQIDYAAPTGTPVVATARGSVVSAGWENGWGYIVRLRHDNGYTTHYAHLSKFATGMALGARVSQGQLIGYVGSTGWSTGPHLDYGMKRSGTPVNPLTLDQSRGEPLTGEKKQKFEEMKKGYEELL